MLRLFGLVLVLGVGSVLFSQLLKAYGPGYVLFYYNHYSIETSVWVFIFGIFASLLVLYTGYKLIAKLITLFISFARFSQKAKAKKQRAEHQRGMLAYDGQDWHKASKGLLQSAESFDRPFVSYLLSTKAFIELGDFEQAETVLAKAEQCQDPDHLSLLLAKVDLKLASQDTEGAIGLLLSHYKKHKKSARFLKKGWHLFQKTQRIDLLDSLLKDLNKKSLLHDDENLAAQKALFIRDLTDASASDARRLKSLWRKYSILHDLPDMVVAYSQALMPSSPKLSLQILETALNSHWHNALVSSYIQLQKDKNAALVFLQRFSGYQEQTAFFNLALAKLNLALAQWPEAEKYLKKSLSIAASDEAHYLLAECYAKQSRTEESLHVLSRVFT